VRVRAPKRYCPPNKGGSEADPLGRGKGLNRKPSVNVPWRPAKDLLKQPRKSVLSEKRAALPKREVEKTPLGNVIKRSRRQEYVPWPIRKVNEKLLASIGPGEPLRKRNFRTKKSKVKFKYQKWILEDESWNLKRSPRLKKLKKNFKKVVRGKNPYYQFKDVFKNVKIRNLGNLDRYKSILKGGFLATTRSIGIRVTAQIRKVENLSTRDMEILISKLPFWATSYTLPEMRKLCFLIRNQVSNGRNHAKLLSKTTKVQFTSGSRNLRGAYVHVPTDTSWSTPKRVLRQ
jgi:hypothetical protein